RAPFTCSERSALSCAFPPGAPPMLPLSAADRSIKQLAKKLWTTAAAAAAAAEAIDDVIVHHTDGLHEGVADGRADEAEAALGQVLAHRVGLLRRRGDLLHRRKAIHDRLAADEGPDIGVESAELLLHGEECLGVGNRGID